MEARGRRAAVAPCDVTDEQSIAATAKAAAEAFGRLDIAIANAGFAISGRIEDLSADDWHRQLDTNVIGAALTARYALPALRESRGRIGLIGSVSALVPMPKNGAYVASKAALRAIGLTLSMECHGSGVTCTTIHPGLVESEIARVDNAGVYRPERSDRRPQRLMWPADRAAAAIVRALHQRRREYVFTGHGRVGGFVGQHFPGLLHFVTTRAAGARRR